MNTKQLLGVIGSVILFVGVFSPVVSAPFTGDMNYFRNGKPEGIIVLVLAVTSLVLALTKNHKWMWITGISSLGAILFTFIDFQSRMSEIKSELDSTLAGNPFRGIADMALQSVQLQWGWALLVIGSGLIVASAALKETSAATE